MNSSSSPAGDSVERQYNYAQHWFSRIDGSLLLSMGTLKVRSAVISRLRLASTSHQKLARALLQVNLF